MLSAEQRTAQYRKKCDSCRRKEDGGRQGDHGERKPDEVEKERCTPADKANDDAEASTHTGCAAMREHEKETRGRHQGQRQEEAKAKEKRRNPEKNKVTEGKTKRSTKAEEATKMQKTDSIWCHGCGSQRQGNELAASSGKNWTAGARDALRSD